MVPERERAKILVDVDGVLNPVVRPHSGYRRHRCSPGGTSFKLWLDRTHGAQLLGLAERTEAELVWATYWCDSANVWIAPRIGLPTLPYVPIPELPHSGEWTYGSWKARHVAACLGDAPFVWFEDEPDAAESLAGLNGLGSYLLVEIDPYKGLKPDHLAQAAEWLADLPAA